MVRLSLIADALIHCLIPSLLSVIRAGLLSGKLSQLTQTLHVTRSTARTFEREQWEALEKRLLAWKVGLAGVLEIVMTARKRGEIQPPASLVPAVIVQTQPIAS